MSGAAPRAVPDPKVATPGSLPMAVVTAVAHTHRTGTRTAAGSGGAPTFGCAPP